MVIIFWNESGIDPCNETGILGPLGTISTFVTKRMNKVFTSEYDLFEDRRDVTSFPKFYAAKLNAKINATELYALVNATGM